MKYVADILENVSNTLNPIVIKELRQAVQGRFLAAVLLLFLGIQLLTIGLFLTDDSVSWSFNAGRNIFKTLASMLLGTCLILVPAYTGLRLAMERADANVDLLFITTLRPRSIIWGKFFAALVFSALLYSVCMPFITLTYLLRGIDLPSIFVLLALNFLIIAVAIQCTILLGCLPAESSIQDYSRTRLVPPYNRLHSFSHRIYNSPTRRQSSGPWNREPNRIVEILGCFLGCTNCGIGINWTTCQAGYSANQPVFS